MTIDEFNKQVNEQIQRKVLRAQRKEMLNELQQELDDAQKVLDALCAAEIEIDRQTNNDGYKSVAGQIAAFKAITAQANVFAIQKQMKWWQ